MFPEAVAQTYIVHLIRSSTQLVDWKHRKALAQALKSIYRGDHTVVAEPALSDFESGPCGETFPTVAQRATVGCMR